MFSRIVGKLELAGLLLIGVVQGMGLSHSTETPEALPQSQIQPAAGDVSSAEEWFLKGNAADRAGNKKEAILAYQEAAKLYQQAVDRNPGNAALWRRLGFVYWLCNQTDQAMAAYKEAIRLQLDDAESHNMLGAIQASNLGAAIMEYREAVRLRPTEAKYHLDLGRALAQNGDLDASIAELQEASRLNPKDGESHAFWGGVLQKRGDIDGAISEYRKALSLELTDIGAARVRQSLIYALAMERKGYNEGPRNNLYTLDKAQEWWTAVVQHSPGESDAAAVMIGSWPTRDLEAVLSLIKELAGQASHRPRPRLNITGKSAPAWLGTSEENKNRILKRGALLHTDIALLELETGKDNGYSPKLGLIKDGRAVFMDEGQHLQFARLLLDSVSPHPSRDEMVRQWYIATTAYVQSRRHRVYTQNNLKRALEIFPSDAEILFYAGVLHETYAAPRSQNALPPPGVRWQYGSKKSELELALQFLQQAVAANPRFADARLRLGRVLGLIGNHDRAVAELQQAVAAATDQQLLYYAALFLGHEQAILGRRAEAREQFERAASLYPTAQSPLLALSQLARSSGDYQSALLAIQRVVALPAANFRLYDPWWEYDLAHVRNAGVLMAEMRKAFGGLPQ